MGNSNVNLSEVRFNDGGPICAGCGKKGFMFLDGKAFCFPCFKKFKARALFHEMKDALDPNDRDELVGMVSV